MANGKGARPRANGGDDAEARAAAFLEGRGLRIVARNYRCKFGEIDIIARSGATTVFVEVRSRASDAFGGAIESITAAKRKKLIAAANHYLARHNMSSPCRFDVVLLTGIEPHIEWIANAFEQ